jgi:HSP20 family protein
MAKKESKESKELVRGEPRKVLSPFEDMEHRLEEMFRRPFSLLVPSWFPRVRMPEMKEISPTVDVFEEGGDVVVKAELPGMKKEDIEVKLTETAITISGEKKKEEKVENKNYYRMERSYGSFSRTFSLPAEVETDKAKAQFTGGILQIRVPKTEGAKKKEKKVQIE